MVKGIDYEQPSVFVVFGFGYETVKTPTSGNTCLAEG